MLSHLKDCLVESPSMAGSSEGENEVEGVKVRIIIHNSSSSPLHSVTNNRGHFSSYCISQRGSTGFLPSSDSIYDYLDIWLKSRGQSPKAPRVLVIDILPFDQFH